MSMTESLDQVMQLEVAVPLTVGICMLMYTCFFLFTYKEKSSGGKASAKKAVAKPSKATRCSVRETKAPKVWGEEDEPKVRRIHGDCRAHPPHDQPQTDSKLFRAQSESHQSLQESCCEEPRQDPKEVSPCLLFRTAARLMTHARARFHSNRYEPLPTASLLSPPCTGRPPSPSPSRHRGRGLPRGRPRPAPRRRPPPSPRPPPEPSPQRSASSPQRSALSPQQRRQRSQREPCPHPRRGPGRLTARRDRERRSG